MQKKVFILGSCGIPARYGGFETYAENISKKLTDYYVWIACEKKRYSKSEHTYKNNNIHRYFINFRANGIQSLIYDFVSLTLALKYSNPNDTFILLGIGFGLFIPFFRKLKSRNLVIHTDGIEWKRNKWNKGTQLLLRVAYKQSLKYANSILVDNKALLSNIPDKYKSKVVHTLYGSDHLPQSGIIKKPEAAPYALVIARAEPENNLDTIIEAFIQFETLNLILITNYYETRYGNILYKKYAEYLNIYFIDAIYNHPELLHAYRKCCYVYIHGHSAGGTNPSLVEAMASRIPVIASNNVYNRTTTNNYALYFNSSADLIHILKTVTPKQLLQIKSNLYKYAKNHYTWNKAFTTLQPVLNK